MVANLRRILLFVLAVLAAQGGAWAEETRGGALADLADGGHHRVVAVVDGDTVVLDDGRQVRLVGIQAPKLPLGRAGFKAWPLGEEAKARVEVLVRGQEIALRLGSQPVDRHGRILAHVVRVSDGLWLQGALLGEGLARVYTFPDNRLLAAEMLARERAARDANAGLWALPYYAIRSAETARFDQDTYQLVEGRVLNAAEVRGRVYLNFGPNWRTDFTVKINARDVGVFADAGLDLLALKGQRVRVRGWIGEENGPMIVLDHPERLEVLGR